jgi:hypothetical protein
MSRWNNWPDYIDGQMDDAQTYFMGGGQQRMLDWYDRYGPQLIIFASQAQDIWRAHGFTVEVTRQESSGMQAGAEGWIEQDGIRTYWIVGPMTPRHETPAEFAKRIEDNWGLERAALVAMGTYQMPAAKGPETTVPRDTQLQQQQAPNTPDPGTRASTPGQSDEVHTFDEWNWLYKQETGRTGPAPEAVGFPLERRSANITRAEWWQYTRPWYEQAGAGTPGGGGGGSTGGGNTGGGGGGNTAAPQDYRTLLQALLAVLGLSGLVTAQ